MMPSAAAPALAAALTLAAALLAPSAPLPAQTAPPVSTASAAPGPWRPLIVVDPRDVLRFAQHHSQAPKRKPTLRPRAHATAAPGEEVFERYDTAPSPHPR